MQKESCVKISKNRVFRIIDDIEDAQKVLLAIEKLDSLKANIVDTKILHKKKNILEHAFITPIIHSGEYTESMLYDVTKLTFDLIFGMLENNIYSFDLLPHNFTYSDGKWVLFDFGAFEPKSTNVKTQIRSSFKITFSSFELLKIIQRKELKHYFLNRIKLLELIKMIPFKSWLKLAFSNKYCLALHYLGLNKQAYKYLKKLFDSYYTEYQKRPKQIFNINKDENLFKTIDDILVKYSIQNCFGIGETFANWCVASTSPINKFAYIDDYEICDSFYNYINSNKVKNVLTSVVAPLVQDDEQPLNLPYSGLYDCFAQDRYIAYTVIILDFGNLISNTTFNYELFAQNIVRFSKNNLLIKIDKNPLIDWCCLKTELSKVYESIEEININNLTFLMCQTPKKWSFEIPPSLLYQNDNRGTEQKAQSKKIIDIINSKNKNLQ